MAYMILTLKGHTQNIRAHTGKDPKEGERGGTRPGYARDTVLCGVISERINFICLLSVLGHLIITRGNILLSALLGFRRVCARGWRRSLAESVLTFLPRLRLALRRASPVTQLEYVPCDSILISVCI